jgi:DMSO reductase family type II enzyme heme b subunit
MPALRGLYRNMSGRLTPRGKAISVLGVFLLLGVFLSVLNIPMAASAANAVAVKRIENAVPTDPQSLLWNQASESQIPLSAQQIYQPGGGTTRMVRVRALEDGHDFAVMVSWDDDTRNDTLGEMPSDAMAVQLPIDPSHLPYQCMGQTTSRVNIWQWKAALERQALDSMGAYSGATSFVGGGTRNLTSNGICKAVDTPGTEPTALSYHDGKQWHVVFHRVLGKGDVGTAPLGGKEPSSIAFAVWNGARGEARGMKAVSTWNTLQFQTAEESNAGNLITLGAVILASAAVVAFTMRRLAA